MRKILLSLTATAAVLAPLALAGTASASAARPAACCVDAGSYYTSMASFDHWFHVNHVNYMARRARGLN